MRFPAFTMVTAFVALAVLGTLPAVSAPTIEFQTMKFDIGKPFEGEKIKLHYDFKNVGDSELEITGVKAACGCTEAKATETKIPSGQSATIVGAFNTAGYRTTVNKTIEVTTNDPAHPTLTLEIAGEVVAIADITPQYSLNLGNVKPGAVSVNEIAIIPKLQQKFKIAKIESTGKRVTVTRFDKTPNKDGKYVIELKTEAGQTPGRFFEKLSIVTDLPGSPALGFPVYGNVEDTGAVAGTTPKVVDASAVSEKVVLPKANAADLDKAPVIEFEKTTFDIGKVLEGLSTKAIFRFKNSGASDLKITKVKAMCGCTDVKATQTVIPAGKSAAIQVVFDSSGFKSAIEKPVLVATNDPMHSTVRLVLIGEVQPIATVNPEALDFGNIQTGDVSTTKLVITPMPSRKFRVLKAVAAGSHVSVVQFTKTPNKKGVFAATIKLKAGPTPGRVLEKVKFVTDLPGNPSISFPVFGNVGGGAALRNAKTH